LDLSAQAQRPAPVPANPPPAAPTAAPKGQGGNMFAEFGNLVDLNLGQNQQRTYGRAGMQQRGAGQALGGGYPR
jgi:hypothetical protein